MGTDDLLDDFLKSADAKQLQILSVRKTGESASMANRTVESLFYKHRNATLHYRIFIYSLSQADEYCPNSLLEDRHNVQPGMVVIFSKNRLLFADWIFDGHGSDSVAFDRQILKCQKDLNTARNLPENFKIPSEEKFSTRPSRRTAWGGEIYRNIESGDFDERFLKTKSEFPHTTKALTRVTKF